MPFLTIEAIVAAFRPYFLREENLQGNEVLSNFLSEDTGINSEREGATEISIKDHVLSNTVPDD